MRQYTFSCSLTSNSSGRLTLTPYTFTPPSSPTTSTMLLDKPVQPPPLPQRRTVSSPSVPMSRSIMQPLEKEQPPPYMPPERNLSRPEPVIQPRPSTQSLAVSSNPVGQLSSIAMRSVIFQPLSVQRVNNYWLFSRSHPISGSFVIDPTHPGASLKESNKSTRMPHNRKNKNFFREKHCTPNASFATRQGAIDLDLTVEGDAPKAFISVQSRKGRISVNLGTLQQKRHDPNYYIVDIRLGHIIVYLPKSFNGLIQIRTRKGDVEFLPAFAQNAGVVHGKDHESLIRYCGDITTELSVVTEADLQSLMLDHCLLTNRAGKIVIGVSGIDHYEPRTTRSVLQKIFGL
ncbi:hypothetical protein C8Q75DRAFT_804770 [Abortiporus biennis]|nr:hypothetical protein C8Q75DRAFT_804770 [Abortiporus biennis]